MAEAMAKADSGRAPRAPQDEAIKLLIADDHPLVLVGIRRSLEGQDDIRVVGQAQSGPELRTLIDRRRPDLVLMDLRMPGADGASLIAEIKTRWPALKIVVLSACDDRDTVQSALLCGASAYIVKSAAAVDIASVLRAISSGGVYPACAMVGVAANGHSDSSERALLTERERTILAAIAEGLPTKRISKQLWVSEHTVKFHLTNIYRKLGVENRSAAVRYAIEHGLAGYSARQSA